MPRFTNSPALANANNEGLVRRFVHTPFVFSHNGFKVSIKSNGKTVITTPPKPIAGTNDVEYDEVEIPASLVFKLSMFLKSTREEKFVSLSEVSNTVAPEEI